MQNASVGLFARIITILAGYLARVVFTHSLGADYIGINGLFLDIMNLFSLSELGFGTAITYALYKPIANHDIEKQKSLMRLYQRFYRIVSIAVLVIGLAVLPFLNVLIRDKPQVDHIELIYLMYLSNTVLSYLLIYKRTLVDAHQRLYIGVLSQSGFLMLQYIVQCIVLVVTKNYILYLSIYLICTIANNVTVAFIANRDYPYLKDKQVEPLAASEKHEIRRNLESMMMHKVGNVVVNSTDNLLLSALVGTISVACYSNYFLLIGSVRQVLNQVFTGITASVGNLGVNEPEDHIRNVFETAFFISQWLFGWAAICLYELLSPFVAFSFGSQYVFSNDIVLMLCINFYITGLRQASLSFRDSLGLFWYDRYKSIAESIINLVVSIILGRLMGVFGIFLGTFISTITTSTWVEPYVLYKIKLGMSPKGYYLSYVVGCIIQAGVWVVTHYLCSFIAAGPVWQFVGRGLLCMLVPNLMFILIYLRNKHFYEVIDILRKVISRISGKLRH